MTLPNEQKTSSIPRRRIVLALAAAVGCVGIVVASVAGGTAWWHQHLIHARYAAPPEGMVFVPPGDFQKGSDDAEAEYNERPAKTVFVAGFYIDRNEVSNADFQRFDPSHSFAPEKRDFPVTKCLKADAERYAEWAGKRLPTGNEWEKAARGTDGRNYPWGNEFDPAKANLGGKRSLEPVGSYPEGASPYGALDMSGNAWEWIADTYNDAEQLGVAGTHRGIIRGGAYAYSAFQGRCSHIGFESDDLTCGDLGFRCVKDAVHLSDWAAAQAGV